VAVKDPKVAVIVAELLPLISPLAGDPVEAVVLCTIVNVVAPVGGFVFQRVPYETPTDSSAVVLKTVAVPELFTNLICALTWELFPPPVIVQA
jgi:hypothetical protein